MIEDLELEFKKFLADCKKRFSTTREVSYHINITIFLTILQKYNLL